MKFGISIIIHHTCLIASFESAHLLYSQLGPIMLIVCLRHPNPFAYLHRCSSKCCLTNTLILHGSGHLMKVFVQILTVGYCDAIYKCMHLIFLFSGRFYV